MLKSAEMLEIPAKTGSPGRKWAFSRTHGRYAAAAALAVLISLYTVVILTKLYHWPAGAPFSSDPAFRFRYVRMYAEGQPIPALDRAAQWPEGLDPRRADFLTQDALVGLTYRLLKPALGDGVDLQRFLRWHVAAWGSLSIFVVYLWARRLSRGRAGALLAAAFYAFALPIYVRTCGNYLREDFVLPVFFLALYAQTRTAAGGGWRWAAAAAAAHAVALVGWHASSFLYFFAAVPAAALAVTSRKSAYVARAALALVAAGAIGFAVHPALREKALWSSPAFALAVAAALTGFLAWRRPALRWWARLGVLAGAFAALYALGRPLAAPGEYSHIYTMVFYKLRYLGTKPADPRLLPLAAREIWTGPANSPTLAAAAALFLAPALAALPPLVRGFRGFVRGFAGGEGTFGAATLSFVVLFASLFAIYQRFSVVLVFFAAVLVAGYRDLYSSRRRLAWLVIPALLLPLEGVKALRYEDRPWPWRALLAAAAAADKGYAATVGDEQYRLIRWFSRQPDVAGAAVVAPIADAAMLLTYAGAPIVLHPIYEAPGMRAKVRACWEALYGPEDEFWRVCEKYDAMYVAYHAAFVAESGPESIRYTYAVTRVPTDSCAWRMQFAPATLRHFVPVFQTVSWRVFLVGAPGSEAPDIGPASPLFTAPPGPPGRYYDDAYSREMYDQVEAAVGAYNDGAEAFERGDLARGRAAFRRALELCPGFAGAWGALALLELRAGDARAAGFAATRALTLDPYDEPAAAVLGQLRRP